VRLLHSARRELWEKYRRAMGGTDLPVPFDEVALIRRLAERRGRPIELIAVPERPGLPCGLLVVTGEADCILYAGGTSPLHRRHILLHEAAHLVCGHDRQPASSPAALLPHLPDALVGRVLGRTVYSEPQEHEAELLASLICTRAACDTGAPPLAEGQQRRLGSVFGVPWGRGRG
jgi:hypothetical protein